MKHAKDVAIIIEKSEVSLARGSKDDSHLGTGGFGKVYVCKYKGEEVVLKKISLMKAKESDIKMIIDEVISMNKAYKITQKIPKFLGIYKGKTKIGLVMEFIKGSTFLKLYKTINDSAKVKILIQITEILKTIHADKLIHRDLKPENIMVNMANPDSPIAYLIDFGLCKIAKNTRTRTGSAKGTSQYKGPELFDEELELAGDETDDKNIKISYKVDIWALGAMISEVFSGVIPWSQKSTSWLHIETMLSQKEVFPIPAEIKDDKIVKLVKRCVDVEPDQRPTDAEVIDELNLILKTY